MRALIVATAALAAASLLTRIDMVLAADSKAPAPVAEKVVPPPVSRMEAAIARDIAATAARPVDRAEELRLRERLAQAAEARLDARLQARPPVAEVRSDARGGDRGEALSHTASLVKLYQAMRPRDAARIFERLDLGVQTTVALRMRERALAAIMAEMSPEGATRLTMAMARRPETLRAPA